MANKKCTLLRKNINILKDILIEYFPEDLSEDWLANIKNEKGLSIKFDSHVVVH